MKTLLILLVASLTSTGCVPMIIMRSMDHDHYSQYVETTNQLNTDREKSHLEPLHVLTFDEWKHGEISTNSPAK